MLDEVPVDGRKCLHEKGENNLRGPGEVDRVGADTMSPHPTSARAQARDRDDQLWSFT